LTAFLEYQEDDEATLEADEALITESERREELNALQKESELPLDQLLKNYKMGEGNEISCLSNWLCSGCLNNCIVFGSLVEHVV
jgi:hypothetical protein